MPLQWRMDDKFCAHVILQVCFIVPSNCIHRRLALLLRVIKRGRGHVYLRTIVVDYYLNKLAMEQF